MVHVYEKRMIRLALAAGLWGILAGSGFTTPADDAVKPQPRLDPKLVQQLPPDEEQPLVGLPVGLVPLADAEYSVGTAVGADGSVYFTEFNRRRLSRLTPDGKIEILLSDKPALYGVAIDREGNLFVGMDSDTHTGQILRRTPQGVESAVVTGLTRPRQMTCDAAGNLYYVLEGGEICKWDRATGKSTTLLSGLLTPQGVAVTADGTLYYTLYGRTGSGGVALEPGAVYGRRTDGTTRKLAGGFWRTRGLGLHPSGDLFVAAEANAWDQGNSGILVRVSPDGTVKRVFQGWDYPQMPVVGRDGRTYVTLARDCRLVAFDPLAVWADCPWPASSGLRVSATNGAWLPGPPAAGEASLNVTVQGHRIEGHATIKQAGQPLGAWMRIPAEQVTIDRNERTFPALDVAGAGFFPLPKVEAETSTGSVRATVLALRGHVRCRWPMDYSSGHETPGPGFEEKPIAYLVFVELKSSGK